MLGLAERRPSVVMGDRVYVTPADGVEGARTRQQSAQTRGPNCEFEVMFQSVQKDSNALFWCKLGMVQSIFLSGFRLFECRSDAHACSL